MSFINDESGEFNPKIVLWGPHHSGKTTFVAYLHSKLNGDPVALPEEPLLPDAATNGVAYWDLIAVSLGKIGGITTRLHVNATCEKPFVPLERLQFALRGVDALICLIDSDPARQDANRRSLDRLRTSALNEGIDLGKLPAVLLYTKRDLPNAVPLEILRATYNPRGQPEFQGVLPAGVGVFDALKALTKLLMTERTRGT